LPFAITASVLYDLVQCPKRVERDMFGDPGKRDEVSPFVEMLWRRGALYEQEVMAQSGLVALDLSRAEGDEKEQLTLEAMRRSVPLIYNGRISAGDLVGIPDLLRFDGEGYIPIDIKSGRGKEGGGDDDGDGKPKLHYAVRRRRSLVKTDLDPFRLAGPTTQARRELIEGQSRPSRKTTLQIVRRPGRSMSAGMTDETDRSAGLDQPRDRNS
jgi:hypothetical protein